jgi:DDE domain
VQLGDARVESSQNSEARQELAVTRWLRVQRASCQIAETIRNRPRVSIGCTTPPLCRVVLDRGGPQPEDSADLCWPQQFAGHDGSLRTPLQIRRPQEGDGCDRGGYSAAMKEISAADRHEVGGRLNNRAENSHQPFRRRERAMQQFRSMKTLQKFSSVHAQVHNQFNQERHLVTRQVYKQRRSIALTEWRALAG